MPDEFLTLAEVMALTDLPRSTIYRRCGKDFPQRQYLNGGRSRSLVWRRADVEAWLAGRAVAARPETRIEGAHFRLAEYPNMDRARAGVRRLALYGYRTQGITPTHGTRAIVHLPLPAGRDPREEYRDLRTFFPDLRFTFHDETGQQVDLTAPESPEWLA